MENKPRLNSGELVIQAAVIVLLTLLLTCLPASALSVHSISDTRLVLIGILDAPPLPASMLVLEWYDAFVLAEVPVADLPALQAQYDVDLLPNRTIISINGHTFDTQLGAPAVAQELRAASSDPYFLIQFYGPVKREWVDALEWIGVTFLSYHPSFAYIVRMDPALLPQVRRSHAVQWTGPYHPAYRLPPAEQLQKALTIEGKMALSVRGFPGEDAAALQRGLEGVGVNVSLLSSGGPPVARVWAAPEQLPRLAAIPGVYFIEPYDMPHLDNERAAQVTHTWDVWRASRNGLLQDLMGDGQIAGAVDSGLDNNTTAPTIEDFYDYTGGGSASRVIYNSGGDWCGYDQGGERCTCYTSDDAYSSGHGTHVAGSIVANGYNALQQRGLAGHAAGADPYFDYAWGVGQAPEAEIAFAHVAGQYCYQDGIFLYCYEGTLCGLGDVYQTWMNVYNAGARSVNNSWGNSTYTCGGDAVEADQIMWDRQDYLVVTSASNDGPGWNTVAQPGTGKNILTVGAALHHRSTWGLYGDSAGQLIYFSSRGPVNPGSDGRAKPDIVAPGSQVLSPRTNYIAASSPVLWGNEPGDGDGDDRPDYAWSGGTSMSAPLATGAATVVRDYLVDVQGMGTPSAALVKAFLLNGAVDMGYGYESFSSAPYGGRNLQGWGMVNVEQSIIPAAPRSFFYDDFTDITGAQTQSTIGFTTSGQSKVYTVTVVDASEPLKVTLHWTDQPNGVDCAAVNDLDLLVISPSSTQYRGNVFSGSWSAIGGVYDDKNNVEAVYVQSPAAGDWTIRVTDANHGGDTQPYAIVVSGGLGPNPVYSRTDSSGRAGTSALPHFPSLKPLTGSPEHTQPGTSFTTSFRLTNWGTNADTISLSYAVTDMSGNGVSGIIVSFNPAGPFSLSSGSAQDIQATVSVGGSVGNGPYDIEITATSGGAGSRRSGLVIPLNVIPASSLSNETRVVDEDAPQYASDFWGTGNVLWSVYLSATNHINSEAAVWASRSLDGGQTWESMGRVDAGDGVYYHEPVIAGNSDGSSVTVVWPRPHSAVLARTWTSGSGWGSIQTLAAYGSGEWRIGRPDVVYYGGGILAVWRAYDYDSTTTTGGIFFSYSADDGASWSTAGGVRDASCRGCLHNMPQLTLDTARNDVWMVYAHDVSGDRDIRLKRWDGDTNRWRAGNPVVTSTGGREIRPGIGYVAATDDLWVTWHRYPGYADPTARLYYARSDLPTLGFTTYGPYGTRTAESLPAMVVGDGTATYITYLAYEDAYRGSNVYLLTVPPGGGVPLQVDQVSATVDDPPLYARGNAGNPQLLWLDTTVNGQHVTGPTLLYSKNPPDSGDPDYGANLGVAQTLYNLEEDFDLYLSQANSDPPTAVALSGFTAEWDGDGVLVAWETALEINTVGFNLWRGTSPGGGYEQVNAALIPATSLGGVWGGSYAYTDADVVMGTTYYYQLEELEVGGARNWYGPVTVGGTGGPTTVTLRAVGAGDRSSAALVWWGVLVVSGAGLVALVLLRRRRRRAYRTDETR